MAARGAIRGRERKRPSTERDAGSHSVDRIVRLLPFEAQVYLF
jgi:hypothetical protein